MANLVLAASAVVLWPSLSPTGVNWTQGDDLEDLKAQLLDLYHEFSKQDLPGIRKVGELVVA